MRIVGLGESSGSGPVSVPHFVNLSAYQGIDLNGHDEGTLSFTDEGDGWYTITWTGSGGGANDSMGESLNLLFHPKDANGDVVELGDRTHICIITLENDPAEWSGANNVSITAGVVAYDGATIATPGTIEYGRASGFVGTSPNANITRNGLANVSSSSLCERAEYIWQPDKAASPGYGTWVSTPYNTSNERISDECYPVGTAITAGKLICVALLLGNDSSLTSGATYTERVRLSVVAVPAIGS